MTFKLKVMLVSAATFVIVSLSVISTTSVRSFNTELCKKIEVGSTIDKIGDEIDSNNLSHILEQHGGEKSVYRYVVWKNVPLLSDYFQNLCIFKYDENDIIIGSFIEDRLSGSEKHTQ